MREEFTKKNMTRSVEYMGEVAEECRTASTALEFAGELLKQYGEEITSLQQENARISEENARLNRLVERLSYLDV